METKRLRKWIMIILVLLAVYSLRQSSLMGFNFKGMDIGTQKIMLLIGYLVILPTIIFILRYDQEKNK